MESYSKPNKNTQSSEMNKWFDFNSKEAYQKPWDCLPIE
jgi:hypothetical protein